jgi:hypothetical protein
MKSFNLLEGLSLYQTLENRISLTALVAPPVAGAVQPNDEDPIPDPEPSPGPYPGEDPPLEYPDAPKSGPVGPGA